MRDSIKTAHRLIILLSPHPHFLLMVPNKTRSFRTKEKNDDNPIS